MRQKTIKGEGEIAGKGLFGGQEARVVFKPAAVDTGVVFVREDLEEPVRIPALATHISPSDRRTRLSNGKVSIDTVEHCLAAVASLGIDNLYMEVYGPELPAPDASAAEFYRVLKEVGLREQETTRKEFVISNPIWAVQGESSIYALPGPKETLEISYDLDYGPETGIARQIYSCHVTPDGFGKHLSSARTFLLEEEAKQLQARGIGTHIGPTDLLVINAEGPIQNRYRYPNECVRHKIVDVIGDLALVGRPIRGRIVATKSGHSLNQELARKIHSEVLRQDRVEKFGTDALLDIRRIQKILPHRYPYPAGGPRH